MSCAFGKCKTFQTNFAGPQTSTIYLLCVWTGLCRPPSQIEKAPTALDRIVESSIKRRGNRHPIGCYLAMTLPYLRNLLRWNKSFFCERTDMAEFGRERERKVLSVSTNCKVLPSLIIWNSSMGIFFCLSNPFVCAVCGAQLKEPDPTHITY